MNLLLVPLLLLVALRMPARAQAQRSEHAFLFAYRVKPGMDDAFARGYRRHLDWHAQHRDSLAWLAWTIVDGQDAGLFVDGTFGTTLAAFDARVDPAGDGADADSNVTAFAEPRARTAYRLRTDLSRSPRLERRQPGAMQRVTRVRVRPEHQNRLEQRLRELAARGGQPHSWSVYELVSGAAGPEFMFITQLGGWKDLSDVAAAEGAFIGAAGEAIRETRTEVWRYLPKLTYLPSAP